MSNVAATPKRGVARRLGLALAASALLPGCFTFTHTVGRGPANPAAPVVVEETRWFALYGIVPLDDLDSQRLAGTSQNYRIITKFTPIDCVLTALTSFVTFYRQTVIVEK